MKFIVDEIPVSPKECPFHGTKIVEHELPRNRIVKFFLGYKTDITAHYGCCIDRGFCELAKSGSCSKLKALHEEE